MLPDYEKRPLFQILKAIIYEDRSSSYLDAKKFRLMYGKGDETSPPRH